MTTMTPAELRAHCARLGLDQEDLAAYLGVTGRTMRRWVAGAHPIPDGVADEVTALALHTARRAHALAAEVVAMEPDDAGERWVRTWRTEAAYREAMPTATLPASWHRAMAWRVAEMVPGVRIDFTEDHAREVVP